MPPEFSFRSERSALDFAATLMFRVGDTPSLELLDSPARLSQWVGEAGVLSTPPTADERDLADAIGLREAIYRAATSLIARGRPAPGDITQINDAASNAPPSVCLAGDGTITRVGTLNSALVALARDAVELLGGSDLSRLRQCGRAGCTRMFIDRSRGQNRTWCGMRQCGNRVNAAAYRKRQRAG